MSHVSMGKINAAMSAGFRAVTPGLGTPDDRLDTLYKASFEALGERTIDSSFMEAALADAEYLAASAVHFAETKLPDVVPPQDGASVARRSLGLLRVASLNSAGWAELRRDWRREGRADRIPTTSLAQSVDQDGLVVVDYSDYGIRQIEAFPLDDGGCPAKGVILNRFYQRFVEVIYGDA